MYEKKDSSGREFSAADAVNSLHTFSSPFNFPLSSGDSVITFPHPEDYTQTSNLKSEVFFRNEAES
jgi:hypothetical protein